MVSHCFQMAVCLIRNIILIYKVWKFVRKYKASSVVASEIRKLVKLNDFTQNHMFFTFQLVFSYGVCNINLSYNNHLNALTA